MQQGERGNRSGNSCVRATQERHPKPCFGVQGACQTILWKSRSMACRTCLPPRACRWQPVPEVSWVQGDALDLPLPDNSFDAATIGYGLRSVIFHATGPCACLQMWVYQRAVLGEQAEFIHLVGTS